jgi:hypothetical protein
VPVHSESEYEDLLAQWSDLESSLGVLLASPEAALEFEQRIWQYDRWLKTLLQRDADLGLYLLFQLAGNSPVGYSASHALVCAVLFHLMADPLGLDGAQRDTLVHAALTMNVGMTTLQDLLATQTERPNAMQREAIASHAERGSGLLGLLGVRDAVWLDVVQRHHDEPPAGTSLAEQPAVARLARSLRTVDRYAAMISPRQTRAGRSALESIRAILEASALKREEVGHALVRTSGLYPPGTYLRLDNQETAGAVRRGIQSTEPEVEVALDPHGALLVPPRWLAAGRAAIKSAIAAAAMRANLNHFLILQCAQSARRAAT